MASYSVHVKASIRNDLRPIPPTDVERILAGIEALAAESRPRGCEKLSRQERYRVRQGAYRIVYAVFDRERVVHVVKLGHRRAVYRY